MGQNIGTGGRAWGKILGPCEEYTGVDAPENYQSVISLKYIHGRQAVLSLSNTINTSSLSTMGLNVISILYEAHATPQLAG